MSAQQYPTPEQQQQWRDETEFARLSDLLHYLPDDDVDFIQQAYSKAEDAHKGQRRRSGATYFTHVFAVACTLSRLQLGREAIAAGLLHDVIEDTAITYEELSEEFGDDVAQLVEGVTKIGRVHFESDEQQQAENFRKMLLTLNDDVRVIIIKIADRLHNMQTMDSMRPDKQVKIASETLFIYAPLAHRLGLYNIKTELEDLGLKYTEPEVYNDIYTRITESKEEQNKYIKEFAKTLKSSFDKEMSRIEKRVDKNQEQVIKLRIKYKTK